MIKRIILLTSLCLWQIAFAIELTPYVPGQISVEQWDQYYAKVKKKLSGNKNSFTYEAGELENYNESESQTYISFTTPSHDAHPAWVSTQVVVEDRKVTANIIGYYAGDETAYREFYRRMNIMAERILNGLNSPAESNPDLVGLIQNGIYTSSMDSFSISIPDETAKIHPPKGTRISPTYVIKPEKFGDVMDLQEVTYFPEIKGGALCLGFSLKEGETKQLRELNSKKAEDLNLQDVNRFIISYIQEDRIYTIVCEGLTSNDDKSLNHLNKQAMDILAQITIPGFITSR